MAIRSYLVPKIGDGTPGENPFRPAYMEFFQSVWSAQDFGSELLMMVTCDMDEGQHAALLAQPDVVAMPGDADLVGPSLAAALEARKIPATWITGATTGAEAKVMVGRCAELAQRLQGDGLRLFPEGKGLDSRLSSMTPRERQGFRAAIVSLRKDAGGIGDGMTMREALMAVMMQAETQSVRERLNANRNG